MFSIEEKAKDYIYRRFPNASEPERQKYVRDWTNKIKDSQALVRDFEERVGPVRGKKILDAGCGNGGISIAFAMAGAEVHGVEIERELYEISVAHATLYSEAYAAEPKFYLYDGNTLPFEDNFFDYAVSASVLEHTDDPSAYLKEILRVVKPAGSLYLGFPNKRWPKETHTGLFLLTYVPAFLRPFYIKLFHRNPLPDNNLHFYDYFDLQRMIEKSKDAYRWSILPEKGRTTSGPKKILKIGLEFLHLPYKEFLKHILVILKKENT